ncbi:MAG: response regulator [Propionibacteriaceae bacterium]
MEIGPPLYRWMVMSSSDGLWIMDRVGTVEFANPRMAEILGRPLDEVVGMSAYEMYDEAGRRDFRAHLTRLESADTGLDHLEVLVLRPDGTRIWTSSSFFPLLDDERTRVGWVHRMTEFTALKDLNEKLRLSEARLAEAQHRAMLGSWDWDISSDTLTWSDELYRMFNVTPATCPATFDAYLGFVHPHDRHVAQEAVGQVFRGADRTDFDVRVHPHGGGERWIRGIGFVQRDDSGEPVRLGGTAQDVTDSKRAEEHVAQASARYQLLQTMAAAANEAVSLEDAVRVGARELARAAGWHDEAAYLVDGPGVLRELPGTSGPGSGPGAAITPAVAGASVKGLAFRAEQTRVSQRARVDDIESRVAIPVLLQGEVVCVVVLRGDLEGADPQTLSIVEQGLDQLSRVAERQRQATHLAAARDEAMEASRLKSEFLSTMSHEIRTPMNGVIGLTDLLRRTGLDPQQRRLVDGLHETGQTLLSLINDILDLSKIEAGRLELDLVDFEIREVFDRTAALLAESARSKGLTLVVGCHPDVPRYGHGDPGRLAQVLANLGSNAVKFTEVGQVVIHADVVPTARDRADRADPADPADPADRGEDVVLRVEVADTGVGIAAGQRDRLFDPFVQADPSTTSQHGGTGLGLAISRQLVTAMGGEIGVTGAMGSGSVFWFTVTLGSVSAERARRRGTATQTAVSWRGRRALVAVADPTVAAMLVEQLDGWQIAGTAVASAHQAFLALVQARTTQEPYDLAFVDENLRPGWDQELAAADPRLAGTPTVLLTSAAAPARAVGVAATLSVPVRYAELAAAVHSALEPTPGPVSTTAQDSSPTLRGQTILVAEDNQVNQIVAAGLLELLGYTVDLVGDGEAALAAVTGPHRYVAVLMDCRMPRMDGYDATRAIRAQETPGIHLPIVALTASALEDERKRCYAAGMDDFVAKPVQLAQLEDVLIRWVPPVGGPQLGPTELDARSPTATPGIDAPWAEAARLDESRRRVLASIVADGRSLLDRATALFDADVPHVVDTLVSSVATANASGLEAAAHKLKGGADNLGLARVTIIARLLEDLGAGGRLDGAAELVEVLRTELDATLEAVHRPPSARSHTG